MPPELTFPGVYIQEIPSGVRTITGVATSITAFVGATQRGADNRPVTINSFADFERIFGGLWEPSKLGYAVKDFFLNGGTQAIIVRIVQTTTQAAAANTPATKEAKAASLDLSTASSSGGGGQTSSPLTLNASSKGAWGNNLRAAVDHDVADPTDTKSFNLTVLEMPPNPKTKATTDKLTNQTKEAVTIERFFNVSIDPASPRFVPRVLRDNSQLARVKLKQNPTPGDPNPWDVPGVRPNETKDSQGDFTSVQSNLNGDDGGPLTPDLFTTTVKPKQGIFALDDADLFNILCIPPYDNGDVDLSLYAQAASYCLDHRAMLLVDSPQEWTSAGAVLDTSKHPNLADVVAGIGGSDVLKNAAIFFPLLRQPNLLHDNQVEEFVPCGAVAGIFARTDTQRGVWKAPAGLEASLVGVPQLSVNLTNAENGELNPLGVNCLRAFPAAGNVVWGSRTLQGNDSLASEWKYIPVRRTALYIEESLFRGLKWVVFEPNDEPLWAQIRLNVGAFMQNLFRQGAFQGQTPKDAYFVKCDKETTTQNDINLGIVNIVVGFAPLKPAEFVIIKLQQMAGQIQS
jgi:phage tail sheath protein FI